MPTERPVIFESFKMTGTKHFTDGCVTGSSEKFNEFTSKYDMIYLELQQCKSLNSHLLNRIVQLRAQYCYELSVQQKRNN